MDCAIEDETNFILDNDDLNDIESSENFQKFIHELFERNGVLNDLRAYLRGHIVNVLKSTETGDPLTCQKHFTQRLELSYQALNILIAEYLLRLEFSYSLSVFISEIPLSNMVFEFARTILKAADTNLTGLRFGECDVWSILNYLGIKCDSEHASKIVELYNSSQESPLLLCILKCLKLYEKTPINIEPSHTSDENVSSDKTTDLDTEDEKNKKRIHKNMLNKCKHYAFCKTCQSKVKRLKSRYEKKRNKLEKMFEQVKTVYEGEVEMMKSDEQKKIKRSIAKHALELQRHKEQLEESYRAKVEKLEENVKQKKKFLWGLARALRDQHQSMATAMMDVKLETERLVEKENNLKKQLEEAERMLKNKGEKMHNQIVQEIKILADHLQSMKTERKALDKERTDLDNLKQVCDKNDRFLAEYKDSKEDLKLHYVSLKEELNVLKKCIEDKAESKCVVEKGTGMEEGNGGVKSLMNNGVSVRNDDCEDDKLKHLVINDFKKKNVNFSKSNQELKRQSSSSETDVQEASGAHTLRALREENERLKKFAVQQSEHIDALSRERNALQHRVSRAFPATFIPQYFNTNRVRLAGGEQASKSAEHVPFIGKDRHMDSNRRYLINQWRALGHRPPSAATHTNVPTPEQIVQSAPECIPENNISDNIEIDDDDRRSLQTNISEVAPASPVVNINKPREKSPKSVSREAKEKIRNNSTTEHPPIFRDKSPNATLREAKLRLRKLEIEAEAVEKSYLDFKKRQSELKLSKSNVTVSNEAILDEVKRLNIKQGKIQQKFKENYKICDISLKESPELIKKDFDKYLREYQTKYDIGRIHFPNKNAILQKVKPIPSSYTKFNDKVNKDAKNPNYLETPITEFRKFYQNGNSDRIINNNLSDVEQIYEENKEYQKRSPNTKCNERAELEILRDDINKTNNITKGLPELVVPVENNEEIHQLNIKQDIGIENNVSNIKLESLESTAVLEDKNKVSEGISIKDVVINLSDEILNLEQKTEKTIEHLQNNVELNDLKTNTLENDDAIQNKENLLIVEIENVRDENSIQVTKSNDLLLIVESAIDNREIENQKNNEISPQMTIIISPKTPKNIDINENKMSSPKKIEKITYLYNNTSNAIFHPKDDVPSVELSKKSEDSSKIENNSEVYGDDFSADFGNSSPISLPKQSELDDDHFWDS
ncbi:unnamed protein product, partial [Brenthis ino]